MSLTEHTVYTGWKTAQGRFRKESSYAQMVLAEFLISNKSATTLSQYASIKVITLNIMFIVGLCL